MVEFLCGQLIGPVTAYRHVSFTWQSKQILRAYMTHANLPLVWLLSSNL
jgi:hypothetical protein